MPSGKIGWCRNHTNLMALGRKPLSKFTAVFADTDWLRGVVEAVKQNFHRNWRSRPDRFLATKPRVIQTTLSLQSLRDEMAARNNCNNPQEIITVAIATEIMEI